MWKWSVFGLLIVMLLSGCQIHKSEVVPYGEEVETLPLSNEEPSFNDTEMVPQDDTNTEITLEQDEIAFMPTYLEIPAIRLQTSIELVKVLENGQMDVPKAFDRVGILAPWILPGEKGNAVISGHVDHRTGPAVFFNLKKLKAGDQILIKGQEGQKLTFVVQSVESFLTDEAPLERIFGDSDKSHLNLITCTGKYNRKTQDHTHRLVVFSELQAS